MLAANLFADKDFYGEPICIKLLTEETNLGNTVSDEEKYRTKTFDGVSSEEKYLQAVKKLERGLYKSE